MLRGFNIRIYSDECLGWYASGRVRIDDDWMEDMRRAQDELKRRAALRDVENERGPQQATSRPPFIQPLLQPHTQASRQPPIRTRVQTSVEAGMQPHIQVPVQPPAQANLRFPFQAPMQLLVPVPSRVAVSPDVESIAALRQVLGDEGLQLILGDHQFALRMRRDFPPFVLPLGVVVGVLRQNARVAVVFHVMLPQHPADPVGKTWYALSMVSDTPVVWDPPDRSHERLVTEIDLHPVFDRNQREEDFLGLLCLVVIKESQQWLGDPHHHRIPIAYYCRGRLIQMCRDLMTARTNNRVEGEVQERRALQDEISETMADQTNDVQPQQQAEAAQTLLGISQRTEGPSVQQSGELGAMPAETRSIGIESFVALQHAIGKEALAMLREAWRAFAGN